MSMGASNVSAVYLYWNHLASSPLRLLTHMALVSLDPPGKGDTAPCLYWGDIDTQILAMNYSGKHAARRLRRVRAELVEAGALERIRPSARHRSPTWRVVPDPGSQDHLEPLPWLLGGSPRPYLGGSPRP